MAKSSRIIKDIESIDQAIKAEENVEGGYHKTIDEYLTYWMAVEEDVVESYTRLAETMQNTNVRKTLGQLIEDSKEHRKVLEHVSLTLKEIMKDEERHAKMLVDAKALLENALSSQP